MTLPQATQSDEIPLKGLTDSIAEAFGPALDAIAEEQRKVNKWGRIEST